MLGWFASAIYLISSAFGFIYFVKSRKMLIYRYLSFIALLNAIEGVLLFVVAALSAYNSELYYSLWYLMLVIYFIIMIDIIVFAYSNMNEGIKKAMSVSASIISLTVFGTAELTLTPGRAMTLISVGFIFALILDLIYITSKVYRAMKGGKLYELWKKILLLTLGYLIFGVAYNVFGVIVMLGILLPEHGLLLISFGYAIKTFLGYHVVDFYFKAIEPILKEE